MSPVNSIQYFLGANSPTGFYSLYDQLLPPEQASAIYILKGGPGCGKSTLMRRVAALAQEAGEPVEYILCSGDPDSLDAILLPGKPDLFRGGVADLDGRLLRQDGHLHGRSHFLGHFFGQGLPGGLSGVRRGFLSGSGGGIGLRCGSSVRGGDLRLGFQRGDRRGETKQGTQCQRERKHSALYSLVPLS